jgi:osmoprotectant transport system ATP-binding protein
MIKLDRVVKSFGSTAALKGVTLAIPENKTTVLLGPSGCGKSTLLRLLIGLIFPDSGTITIEKESPGPKNVLRLRRQIGYVIQQGGLFPHLTARQNVELMARYLGRSKTEIEANVIRLAHLTKFPLDGLDRYPLQLSGGQNQRVSLMRALILEPKILLLDEPMAALDPLIRYELQRDLREIFTGLRKTVILVTHDIAEAAILGDQTVFMKDGRILQEGTIREMRATPADIFIQQFIQAQLGPRLILDKGEL